jgi:hypothetical protein
MSAAAGGEVPVDSVFPTGNEYGWQDIKMRRRLLDFRCSLGASS